MGYDAVVVSLGGFGVVNGVTRKHYKYGTFLLECKNSHSNADVMHRTGCTVGRYGICSLFLPVGFRSVSRVDPARRCYSLCSAVGECADGGKGQAEKATIDKGATAQGTLVFPGNS